MNLKYLGFGVAAFAVGATLEQVREEHVIYPLFILAALFLPLVGAILSWGQEGRWWKRVGKTFCLAFIASVMFNYGSVLGVYSYYFPKHVVGLALLAILGSGVLMAITGAMELVIRRSFQKQNKQ